MNSHPHHHPHAHDMTNSHLLVQEFEYHRPATAEEAVALLQEQGSRAAVLAGGTFLLVQMKMEQAAPRCLIDVGALPGLCGIGAVERVLEIGSRTTIWAVRSDASVQADYTALADACAAFGSTQIQLIGTLGGNICNASPASDTVPPLVAAGAELVLVSSEGERTMPLEEFLVGPGETKMRSGELLVAVRLPVPASQAGSAFVKISRVRADLAKASAAAALVREGDRIVDCRLAFGAVGPTVLRPSSAEKMLIGESFSSELALAAGRAASREVTPIDDVRSSARYRRRVVEALTHDALEAAWNRAGERGQGKAAGLEVGRAGQGESQRIAVQPKPIHLSPTETYPVTLKVNGVSHELDVRPNELLINVLRDRLNLTGTKYGCGIGECGACTVHIDGVPALSCLTLAVAADGREVTTVEGLGGPDGELDLVQEAFIEDAGFQCGYCTPGMLMMTKRLLAENPTPDEDEIRDYLKGNRCRCTGFAAIVRAVRRCVEEQKRTVTTG